MPAKKTSSQYNDLKDSVRDLFDQAGNVIKKSPQRSTKKSSRKPRKPVAVPLEQSLGDILSQRALDVLKKEKDRTGKNLLAILEKAVLNLASHGESNDSAVIHKGTRPSLSVTPAETDYRSRTLERIVAMKENDSLSFDEIASRFNKEGLTPFSGKGRWHGITISAMYKRFKNR